MHTTTLLLASLTATLTTALPTTETFTSKTFTINMQTNQGYQPLTLIQNGTEGQFVLEASSTKGTPAYYTGTSKNMYHSLFMTLPCGTVYALEIPQVGDNYGYAAPIYGVENGQQKQWIVDKYGLSAELQAALDSLYACRDHANGKQGLFLKFGVPQSPNLYPPVGCDPTVLKPDFDVSS